MNQIRTIAKNMGLLLLNQAAIIFLSAIFVGVMARKLGVAGYGKYSFAVGFTSILAVLADFGLNDLAMRDIAREKEKVGKYLSNVIALRLVLSALAFGGIIVGINILRADFETRLVVYFIGGYMILTNFTQLFRFVFFAFEKMQYGVRLTVADKILSIILGLAVLLITTDVVAFSTVFLFVGIITLSWAFCICSRKICTVPRPAVDLQFWRYLLGAAFPLGLVNVFTMGYMRINTTLLDVYKNATVVGLYAAAFNLYYQLSLIPNSFLLALFPRLSQAAFSDQQSAKSLCQKSLLMLLLMSLPIVVGIGVLAGRIIILVYGNTFIKSILLLRIFDVALFFSFVNFWLQNVLTAHNKQKFSACAYGVALGVLLTMDVFLIPRWGGVGAAIAMTIAEVTVFGLLFSRIPQYLGFVNLLQMLFRPAMAALGMGVILFFVRHSNLLIAIPLGALAYFVLLVLLGGLSKDEVQLVKSLVIREQRL
jgi:O-antigen/teichoic acid export membrane protein